MTQREEIDKLPAQEREKIACMNYLSSVVNNNLAKSVRYVRVKMVTNGEGHYISRGITVYAGYSHNWVEENLPEKDCGWVGEYLKQIKM